MQTISARRQLAVGKFRPRNRRNTLPLGPGHITLPISPTFLQFNVCKRILFQSLAPSSMVLLESPPGMFTSPPAPTKVFPAGVTVCHTTCSLIFSNANIMSEPVKTVPFFPLSHCALFSRTSIFSYSYVLYFHIYFSRAFCERYKITMFCFSLLRLLNIFACEMKYRLRRYIFKVSRYLSFVCDNKLSYLCEK